MAKLEQEEVDRLAGTIRHEQQSTYYDQIIGEVVLVPGDAEDTAAQNATPIQIPTSAAAEAWAAVQTSTSPAVLRSFIDEFPASIYANFAGARLAELTEVEVAVGWGSGNAEARDCRLRLRNGG